jgi:hypothetical protein
VGLSICKRTEYTVQSCYFMVTTKFRLRWKIVPSPLSKCYILRLTSLMLRAYYTGKRREISEVILSIIKSSVATPCLYRVN